MSSWADRKAGVALTQGTGSLQPTRSATSLGGTPGVTGDGADDVLSGAAGLLNTLTGFEAAANCADTGGTANHVILEYGTTGGNAAGGASWMAGDGSAGNLGAFVTATTLADRFYADDMAAVATRAVVVDGTIPAGIASLWKDGVSQSLTGAATITPPWTGGNNSIFIFARSGGALAIAGTIGDLVITRPLTTAQRTQLHAWLMKRRGA